MPAAIMAKRGRVGLDRRTTSEARVSEYLAGLEAEVQVQEDGDSHGGGSDGKPTATPDRKPYIAKSVPCRE
jgi:hypothetical protein